MMRAAVVFHRVLYELEAGQSHGVERKMIGSTRVPNAQGRHSQVFEGLHPGLKDRRHGFVALQIDTSNRSGAVVNVKVACEFRMVRLQLHVRAISKMLCDICARSKKTFFFSGPQPEANSAS